MTRLTLWPVSLCLLLLVGVCVAHGGEESFTADDSGFTLTVTGIEGVEAIARTVPGAAGGAAFVNQGLIGNRLEGRNVRSESLIQHSFQNNRGIVSVNQASGSLNNQANLRVLALAEVGSLVQDLEIWGSTRQINNTLISSGGDREDRIANSFGGTVGIVGANQSSGNLNQQANVLVVGIGVAFGPEAVSLGDATLREISANNTVKQEGEAGRRAEIITDSFRGFRGIAQVSQSAGDLNTLGNFVGLSLTVVDVP